MIGMAARGKARVDDSQKKIGSSNNVLAEPTTLAQMIPTKVDGVPEDNVCGCLISSTVIFESLVEAELWWCQWLQRKWKWQTTLKKSLHFFFLLAFSDSKKMLSVSVSKMSFFCFPFFPSYILSKSKNITFKLLILFWLYYKLLHSHEPTIKTSWPIEFSMTYNN